MNKDTPDPVITGMPSKGTSASKQKWVNKHPKEKLLAILILGSISIVLLFIFSLTVGVYSMSFTEALDSVINIILHFGPSDDMTEKIIYNLRMPRSISVLCVGAGLAVAGAIMQSLIRNPLVDPYITGVSSGAAFTVVLVTLGGFSLGVSSGLAIPIAAIIGAIAAFSLTMVIAEATGGKAMSYVLAGVIISTGLSAATTLVIYFNSQDYASIMRWMFGSFMDLSWSNALVIAFSVVPIIFVALIYSRKMNIILLGDEHAKYLGMDTRMFKLGMMVLTAILTAFCVAYCGVIGFIGLIIPHVCRMILGGDNRLLIPASAILGALVMLVADIFCKTVMSPSELPIGAVVAVVGVPFFLYLLIKEGKKYAM
jgi:iron complex transport system permease protein